MSRLAHRWTAAVIAAACAAALAGCSADPDDGPVVINSGSSASSVLLMTPPTTSTSVATAASPSPSTTATSPDPADVTDTEDPSDAEGPDSSDSSGGTGSGDTETSDEPGPGTVIYRGTTYVMPPEETTPLAESLVVTFDVAPGVDVSGVDIEGAEKAYRGFVAVADRAAQEPTIDWSPSFKKYLEEPLLIAVVQEIEGMANRNVKTVGHSAFDAVVVNATEDQVGLRICNDISGVDRIDATDGHSVKAGNGDRHPQDATLTRKSGGKWKVRSLAGYPDKTC